MMKRCVAALLVCSYILFLSGCRNEPVPDNTAASGSTSTDSTTVVHTPAEFTQKPMYSVSLPPLMATETAEDGTTLLNVATQNISLVLPAPEVADQIILDFLNRMDALTQQTQSTLESAKQAYKTAAAWNPYLLQLQLAPMRLDSGVLSLYGSKVSYTGGAHAAYLGESVTYDLLTGKILSLSDIMRTEVTTDTLCTLIAQSLKDLESTSNLFTTYTDSIPQLFSKGIAGCENWYLTDAGLCFYFDPYEIAPFSSGIITSLIPYSLLTGILQDAYFPAEMDFTAGTVNTVLFPKADLENFNQISELILTENSTKALLYTTETVYNVRIFSAEKNDSNVQTVFSAYTLTPGDGIMLEAAYSELDLCLSYRTNEGIKLFTIAADKDAVTLTPLLDDSISSVYYPIAG